jgi:predicted RNA-binding Zn-ribbon protein involved in translation (DUF1610 family)
LNFAPQVQSTVSPWRFPQRGGFIIVRMHRSRSYDPKSFDLTTQCPACGYKIPPAELVLLDSERMRCPSCKQDVVVPTKGGSGTAVPTKSEG